MLWPWLGLRTHLDLNAQIFNLYLNGCILFAFESNLNNALVFVFDKTYLYSRLVMAEPILLTFYVLNFSQEA